MEADQIVIIFALSRTKGDFCDRDRRRFGQRAFLHRIHAFARMWSIVPDSPDQPAGWLGPLGRLGFPGHILSVLYTQAETLHFLQNKSMSSAPSTILNPAGTLSGLVRRSPRINA